MATTYKVACDCCGKDITFNGITIKRDPMTSYLTANPYANCHQTRISKDFSMDLCYECYEEILNRINAYVETKREVRKDGSV